MIKFSSVSLSNLNEVIADSLMVSKDSIKNDTELSSIPSWDSMAHMILVSNIEEKYQVEFSGDEIIEMSHVHKIFEILQSKGIKD